CEIGFATDAGNCGTCGRACMLSNAVPACTAGACTVAACSTGFADCDGRSDNGCEVDVTSTVTDCATCGHACGFPAASASCAMGACQMGSCDPGFANCNANAADGCEVNIQTSVSSCGACGAACSFPNASATCAAGVCARADCNAGYADCDGLAVTGCEVDIRASAANCGACGLVCTTGRCTAGVCDRGGDGSDGPLVVSAPTTLVPVATPLAASVVAGVSTLGVVSAAGFAAGQEVLVIDMQGSDAGHYEFARVAGTSSNTITVATPMIGGFLGASDRVQVIRVYRYSSMVVNAGQALSVAPWNGSVGGVLPIRVADTATIAGDLLGTGRGYRGGPGDSGGRTCGPGAQGESPLATGARATAANGSGGGGGGGGVFCCVGAGQSPGGGGGGHGEAGIAGTGASGLGAGGAAYGVATLARMSPGAGGGGGGGNCDSPSGGGGAGGALIFLAATTLTVTGSLTSAGAQGSVIASYEGAGAGGAGGTLFLAGRTVTLAAGRVTAPGGASNTGGSGAGGAGGAGRVRIECQTLNGTVCTAASSGTLTSPGASVDTY
ncbi:MAG: hypothetical protein WCJ30_20925, partial [Deltaproteobacteria bacterium]